jgi:zinc protease
MLRSPPATGARARGAAPLGRLTSLATAALLAAAPAPADARQSAGADRTLGALLADTVLANGLHVVVLPNPTIPLVTLQVTIRNGAFTQLAPSEVGVPHLLEHMLFRVFGRDGFGPDASRIEASYNGTTDDETVTYYITLPSANLDRGMRLLADLMRAPRFAQRELDAEQLVVRGELERSVADPTYVLSSHVNQRLWGTGWDRKNAIGNLLSIQGATPALLKSIYDRYYVPNNAALVITGDVTASNAFSLAAQHFTRWQRAADPFDGLDLPPMPRLTRTQQVTVELETNDITLLIRWQGPGVRDDFAAAHAADVFTAVVNDRVSGFQSRLVDTGLFQSVSASYLTRAHTGPISLYATTTADQLVQASAALRAELTRAAEPGYVDAELLAIARKRNAVDWAMQMEEPSGLAWFIGDLWSVTGGLDFARGYVDTIDAVSEADVEAFIANYITDRPYIIGVLLSPVTRSEIGSGLTEALAHWRP